MCNSRSLLHRHSGHSDAASGGYASSASPNQDASNKNIRRFLQLSIASAFIVTATIQKDSSEVQGILLVHAGRSFRGSDSERIRSPRHTTQKANFEVGWEGGTLFVSSLYLSAPRLWVAGSSLDRPIRCQMTDRPFRLQGDQAEREVSFNTL